MALEIETHELSAGTDRHSPDRARFPRRAFRSGACWVGLLSLVLIAAYLLSGIFTVAADEQAVVRRFGKVVARLGPGIHYRLPWPVDRIDLVKTTAVMKTGVGFDLRDGEGQSVTGMEMLTGDTNIISVAMVIQYVIRNPADFLFAIEDPKGLIGSLAPSVLTETVLGMSVDEVLTTERLAIQEQVKAKTQAILDRYSSGIQLTSANIMAITLDRSVAQAFQEVANASADREKKINEGRAYANNLLPKARGEARSMVLAAQSYKEQQIAEAIGNTTRFVDLLAEYNKAPDITRSRLYLEAMENILPKVKKYVIDSAHGQRPVNLRLNPSQP
jgi:membrane protease subunit HflK